MAVKAKAPIYTADGSPVEEGMIVFGFDIGCKAQIDPTKYVKPLIVAEIDLGAKRMVRLRKSDGREWRWYAEESRVSCSNDEHLIYASFEKAKKAAEPIIKFAIERDAQRQIKDKQNQVNRVIERIRFEEEDLEERREELSKEKLKAEQMRKGLCDFANLKVSDLTLPA